jgi:hypothetical protein
LYDIYTKYINSVDNGNVSEMIIYRKEFDTM